MLYHEWNQEDAIKYAEKRGMKQGRAEGVIYGEKKKQEEMIRQFSRKLSAEDIAETLQVSLDYVQEILREPMCVSEPQATYEATKYEEQ